MGINDYIRIGDKIKKYRKEKGLSQKEMAKLLEIPVSTYSNYENNNREPSSKVINKISELLNITPMDLINEFCFIEEKEIKEDIECHDLKYRKAILDMANQLSTNLADLYLPINVDILFLLAETSEYLRGLVIYNKVINSNGIKPDDKIMTLINSQELYGDLLNLFSRFYSSVMNSDGLFEDFIFDKEISDYKKYF